MPDQSNSAEVSSPLPPWRWETGDISVQHIREQFIITDAPERASVSLQLLMANPQAMRIVGNVLYMGEPEEVAYRVVEMVPETLVLRLERFRG
jgi:hypothetical protein